MEGLDKINAKHQLTHAVVFDEAEENVRESVACEHLEQAGQVVALVEHASDRRDVIVVGARRFAHLHLATVAQTTGARLEGDDVSAVACRCCNK